MALSLALSAGWAQAQSNKSPPPPPTPPVNYWMDVATYNLMGMDEMPQVPGLGGMMMRGMMNRSSHTGRDGRHAVGVGNFGQTKSMGAIGHQLDIALYTRNKPGGTQATQTIPPQADVGARPLHLQTPPREGIQGTSEIGDYPKRPRTRILFYWGCSPVVKPGQPRILDTSKLSDQDYTHFMQGRRVVDRGARAEAGFAIWPNERENSQIPRESSIAGEHVVSGEGIPEGMRFKLGQNQDFMPSLALQSSGALSDSVQLRWPTLPTARAYLFNAFSAGQDDEQVLEMVMWSSSELPDPGTGLMDYIANGTVDQWLKEKVLLPPDQSTCAIPAGIFAKSAAVAVQGIAYGNELNIVHPPRPADPKAEWKPEWSVRVRNKSVAMNMLDPSGEMQGPSPQESNQNPSRDEPKPKRRVGAALRDLFGH
jgi:hypothetical protein